MAVSGVRRTGRLQRLAIGALLMVLAAMPGPVGGMPRTGGHGFAVVFAAGILVPALFWRVPAPPVVTFVIAGTSIERFADPGQDNLTAKIPLFRSFAEVYHISGVILTPIQLMMSLSLLGCLARGISERRVRVRPSVLGAGVMVLFGMAVAMEVFGLARGGVFNISLWELRPFLYVAVTYLLASQLIGRRAALEAVLWGMVIGTRLQGGLGADRWITPRPRPPPPPSTP